MTKRFATFILFASCLLASPALWAQDLGFSQYYYTPFLTNPAMLGSDNYMHLRLNYRHQPLPNGENMQTPMFSASYPLLKRTGERWGGAGISLVNDRATQFMSTTGGIGAFAYNFKVGKSNLAFGTSLAYFQRKIDASGAATIEQYINGNYNPTASNGESINSDRVGYFNIGLGAYWYMTDSKGEQKAYFGLTGANLNSPQIQLDFSSKDARVPLQLTAIAGYSILPETSRWVVMPNVRFMNFAKNSFANIGSWFRYKINTEKLTTIGTGVWYNTNQALVASVEWQHPRYIFALSYDFSASQNAQVWQRTGSTEVTAGFRYLISRKCKDTDNDNVCDNEDDCPTEAGKPEYRGCPDRDGDTVIDKNDDCPTEAGKPEYKGCPDRDGDTVIDKNDDCPDQGGKPEYRGCPDRDGDTIIDKNDDCPDEAGKPEYKGCPDRDGDTIIDKNDDCPDQAGKPEYRGCPDRDGDTVIDKDDKCPDVAGLSRLQGCPEPEITKEEEVARRCCWQVPILLSTKWQI
jgi:type IX secretion system PorP/SprF family membrane protein